MSIRVPLLRGSALTCLLALAVLAGCTATIIPPNDPPHPTTVLVSDYGRHSSLLLPDPRGGLVEYEFGDWQWYALGRMNLITGTLALIHSPQSTLGRRWVCFDADAPDAAELLGALKTEAVAVDADRVAALRQKLDREYIRHIDSVIFNPDEHLYFVPCDEPYNLFRNCNCETAGWLRELGTQVEGPSLWSRFRVVPAGENPKPEIRNPKQSSNPNAQNPS